MSNTDPVAVYTANARLEAEIIRGALEAAGLTAIISQEGLGSTYGFSVGPLGECTVLVPAAQADEARAVLAELEKNAVEDDQ